MNDKLQESTDRRLPCQCFGSCCSADEAFRRCCRNVNSSIRRRRMPLREVCVSRGRGCHRRATALPGMSIAIIATAASRTFAFIIVFRCAIAGKFVIVFRLSCRLQIRSKVKSAFAANRLSLQFVRPTPLFHRPPTAADAESNDNFFSPSKEKSFFISTGL